MIWIKALKKVHNMVGINTVHKLEFIKRRTSVNRGASLLGIYVICLALLYPSHASSQKY